MDVRLISLLIILLFSVESLAVPRDDSSKNCAQGIESLGPKSSPEANDPLRRVTYRVRREIRKKDEGFRSNYHILEELYSFYRTEVTDLRHINLNGKTERLYLLQIGGIKDLSENLWTFSATENFLEEVYHLIHRILAKNPHLGKLVDAQFKNFYIISQLSPKEYESQFLKPIKETMLQWIHEQRTSVADESVLERGQTSWLGWLNRNFRVGVGDTAIDAHLNLRGIQKFSSWKVEATKRRNTLKAMCEASGISWMDLMTQAHKLVSRRQGGGVTEFHIWVRRNAVLSESAELIFNEALKYLEDLQVADILTVKNQTTPSTTVGEFIRYRRGNQTSLPLAAWPIERRTAFHLAAGSKFVVVTDIEGLGLVARGLQDQWMARGANLEELWTIYQPIDTALKDMDAKSFRALSGILGSKQIVIYRGGGDERVFFLPDMTPDQFAKVQAFFSSAHFGSGSHLPYRVHVSELVRIPDAQTSLALISAVRQAQQNLTKVKMSSH
ncbi:MAG: hypothetical protein IT289_11285 [Oligoflexia bacterium]|nr:hypothetical protein [Oligoflexia bacterium]